ncbi:GIY-YIG nuclease family protein [Pseudorhodoplanes sp.]|uniref:GIY-YIG nuclease family protein n=1 Tax=Pseudorhodoplanes sp. TaxID=1934341 RepID=UPI002CD0407A|nr:GIY-YIG nuclease family protein [Pseudorhodoplanes sp.]HWV43902.1 GIY-YIG nuclease family protein [Pseudorhodoplanes sp.]
MAFWVYILASRPGGTICVGVTNDLVRRTYEHRNGLVEGFTRRYGVKRLVHFEHYDDPATAIQREKNIKHWSREWKIDLIVASNPEWRDLYDDVAS